MASLKSSHRLHLLSAGHQEGSEEVVVVISRSGEIFRLAVFVLKLGTKDLLFLKCLLFLLIGGLCPKLKVTLFFYSMVLCFDDRFSYDAFI